jgi:hypothetical protein
MSKVLVRLSEQKQKDYRLLALEDLIDILPHGSGFDGDWTVDTDSETYPNAIILSNGYHAMDQNGFYSGWLNFTIYLGKPHEFDTTIGDESVECFDPEHWYHTFEIEYDDSDLDYDDGDNEYEFDDNDYDEDGELTEDALQRELDWQEMENPAVNKELLIEYIDATISESLSGIVNAWIEEE